MGNTFIYKTKLFLNIYCLVAFFITCFSYAQNERNNANQNLAEIFGKNLQNPTIVESKEVEPIVVGRKKWNEPSPKKIDKLASNNKKLNRSAKIEELDPLETRQDQTEPSIMPTKPPSIPPAVNIHRNFEGKLVLKPRKLGFERDFPYQLENSRGKRLAYIDTQGIRVIDPLSLKNKKVNILGKLEPIQKGSEELVIRAKILREID